jgi:hypothetical protein
MIKPEFFMRGKPIPFRMSCRLKSLNCMIKPEFFMRGNWANCEIACYDFANCLQSKITLG